MSTYNASSVSKSQNWRNEMRNELRNELRNEMLIKPADPMPLNVQDIFKESVLQKYLDIRSLQNQAGYQGQQGQGGYQCQRGQSGFHGQQGQAGFQGSQGQAAQTGFHGQQGRPILAGQQAQPGSKGSQSQSGLRGQSGQPGQPSQTGQPGQPGHQVLAGATVCCDQADCDQTKIEHIYPEQYMHEPATPFTLLQPPDGTQTAPKDGSAGEQFNMYCPCGLNRGQLVTICCTGRDCDESTKIDDIPMGPPDEKRAKTTYNQFKF